MDKKITRAMAAAMTAAVLLTGCTGGTEEPASNKAESATTVISGTDYKEILHIAVTQQSPSLDLHKNSSLIARQMCDGTVWEKLGQTMAS